MSKRLIRNVAASNRARLLKLSRERDEDFQFLLTRWAIERFLYRLSVSDHKDRFVLKGAMLFLPWTGALYRPTRDLDLLGWGDPSISEIVGVIREICGVQMDDGLIFDLPAIAGKRIREDAQYEGVRIKAPANLDGARVQLQIDIGFGDAVDSQRLEFPTLLGDDAPVLRAYPPETVIAEKLHAMIVLGIANSRMKDFLDVWTLANSREFRLSLLSGTIRATFERRRTPTPEEPPVALTPLFLEDQTKQKLWHAFIQPLAKGGASRSSSAAATPTAATSSPPPSPPPSSLAEVGALLADFLMPAMTAASDMPEALWTPGGPWRPFTNA